VDSADADPGTDAWTCSQARTLCHGYSKGSGQEWTYKGYTLDKFRYLDDKRLHGDQTSRHPLSVVLMASASCISQICMHLVSTSTVLMEIAVPCAI